MPAGTLHAEIVPCRRKDCAILPQPAQTEFLPSGPIGGTFRSCKSLNARHAKENPYVVGAGGALSRLLDRGLQPAVRKRPQRSLLDAPGSCIRDALEGSDL